MSSVLGFGPIQTTSASEKKPNVVLIMIDTLRADLLGCYGSPGDPSPELDALAEKGVRVETVIGPSNWTRPRSARCLHHSIREPWVCIKNAMKS